MSVVPSARCPTSWPRGDACRHKPQLAQAPLCQAHRKNTKLSSEPGWGGGRRCSRRQEGGRGTGSGVWGPKTNRLPVPGTGRSTHSLPSRRQEEVGGERIGKKMFPQLWALTQSPPHADTSASHGAPHASAKCPPGLSTMGAPSAGGALAAPAPPPPRPPRVSQRLSEAALATSGRWGPGTPALMCWLNARGRALHLLQPLGKQGETVSLRKETKPCLSRSAGVSISLPLRPTSPSFLFALGRISPLPCCVPCPGPDSASPGFHRGPASPRLSSLAGGTQRRERQGRQGEAGSSQWPGLRFQVLCPLLCLCSPNIAALGLPAKTQRASKEKNRAPS